MTVFTAVYMCMSSLAFQHQRWQCLGAADTEKAAYSSWSLLGPGWAGAASAWGPPGLPPTGLYRAPSLPPWGLTRFHQVPGFQACLLLPHTRMHAWYAHMIRESRTEQTTCHCFTSDGLCLQALPIFNSECIFTCVSVRLFTAGCHWSKGRLEVEVGSVWTKRRANSNSY